MAIYKEVETLLKEYENSLLNFEYHRFYIGNEIQKGKLFEIMSRKNICVNPDTVVGLVDAGEKFLIFTTDGIYSDSFSIYYDFLDKVTINKQSKRQKNGNVIFNFKDFESKKYLNFNVVESQDLSEYFEDDFIEEFINKLLKSNVKEMENKVNINTCKKEDIMCLIPWANDIFATELCNTKNENGNFKNFFELFKAIKMNLKPLLYKYFEFETKVKEIQENKVESTPVNNPTYLDELKKLKELLDMGAITSEEYNLKKKELLKL